MTGTEHRGRRPAALALAGLLLLLLAAAPARAVSSERSFEPLSAAGGQDRQTPKRLRATIRRTTYGVPHITAGGFEALGAGFGYAFAEDNVCTIADRYVTVAAERSRFFGPDESWTFSGNGATYNNLDSDIYYERINRSGLIAELIKRSPPVGPAGRVRKLVRGYVAGYNTYLRKTGVEEIPDPRCRGADWVRPIRAIDVYRHFHQLGSLASAGAAIDGIAEAEPTGAGAAASGRQRALEMIESGEFEGLGLDIGSNAYGLGGETTANGRGLVLGNPHFPWDGGERLYQVHLRVPGKMNVQGGTLYGVPLVLVGWTRGLAWSHTVATAWRFTPFELTLGPDPHTYLVDGEVTDMEATTVKVRARTAGGGLETRSRTLYGTRYGPMLTSLAGLPLPWGDGKGFALGDVNAENFRYLNHFLRNNMAQSVGEYHRIQRRFQGIPWVNSIAADRRGRAYYTMQGAIPNVPDGKARQCGTVLGQATHPSLGLPVLDGSRSSCDWSRDPRAADRGIFPPSRVPHLFRRDYVHNANDSHWLTNPERPLTGFDRIIGIEGAERSYRTRIGLVQVAERLAGEDSLTGRRFTRGRLQRIALGNRQYLGELWRDSLVQLCRAAPGGSMLGASGPVDVSGACDALAGWNLRDNLGSGGTILFRRFASNLLGNFTCLPTGLQGATCPGSETLFTRPFDSDDPVHTPRGLNVANPLVQRALADAVDDLEGAGIPLAAPLRRFQYEERGGARIPIHGGPGSLGVFNAINVGWDPDAGYPDVPHGTSFVFAAQFRKARCPVVAGTLVAYSQSENQESAHAADYTRAFSRKRWHRAPFCDRQIKRNPDLETERLAVPRR